MGYEGFLGSWLTKTLLDYGARIVGLDILTRRKKTILSKKDLAQIKITRGNVNNFNLVSKLIKDNKAEFIFHLAAESLVGRCYRYPQNAFSTNIEGTWNILEAGRNNKTVKGIIIASSDKAYGNHKNLPYKENYSLCGDHPYDVSKSCADLLANSYFYTYKTPVCVTRCGNIFGFGDFNFSRIIPDTIRSILRKKELLIRSDGKFIRDYIYVGDIVNGYLTLATKMSKSNIQGEAFNFSNNKPISVLELVKLIYKLMGSKPNYKILNKAKYEIKKQFLSSAKARRLLHWKPEYSQKDALMATINSYTDYFRR